jgi:uncharacterized protein (DUF427 family)
MSDHPITITDNPNRVRVLVGGAIVAESTRALSLKEATYPPVLYIPREDVHMDFFEKTERTTRCPHKGEASYYGVMAHGIETPNVAWSYESPLAGVERIKGHLAFYPDKVDAIEELH